MPTKSMTWEQYFNVATQAWSAFNSRGKTKKECGSCLEEFRKERKDTPVFPLDYKGNCPRCGGEFHTVLPG